MGTERTRSQHGTRDAPRTAAGRRSSALPEAGGPEQFFFDPKRACLEERPEPSWNDTEIRLENPLEFQEGLVVKAHVGDVSGVDTARLEAVFDGVLGK